jgi:recombinational DNA repair protein RecT
MPKQVVLRYIFFNFFTNYNFPGYNYFAKISIFQPLSHSRIQKLLLQMANGGTQTACVREYQPNSGAFVLNAMCSSAANCSVEELQRSVSGGKKEVLSELDIEVEGEFFECYKNSHRIMH